jgi:hypothetical protein
LPRPRRKTLAALLGATAMAVAALAMSPTVARADDASTLGGFTLLARANPLQFTYDSPGLLPVSPIVQLSAPESLATLNSGPTGFARSSIAFPGPLLADLGSALKQEGAECQLPFNLQPYPVRAEAFFPQGPADAEDDPVPGARMHSTADGPTSTAFTAFNSLDVPGVFSIGAMSGTSSSTAKGDSAVTKAHSVVSGFSLAAGAVSIGSVVTDVISTSTGDKATTTGTTKVGDVKVGGQNATIDENGISFAGSPVGGIAALLTQLGLNINEALKQSGIDIHLVNQHENKDAGLGERIADGLVINLSYDGTKAPLLSTILALVPAGQLPATNATNCAPSSPQALFNLLKDTHLMSLALGAATVSSNATPGFVAPDAGTTATSVAADLGDTGTSGPLVSGTDLTAGDNGAAAPSLGSSAAPAATGLAADNTSSPGGKAVPFAFILLLALLAPVIGGASRRVADAALAPAAAAAVCPLEDQGET